MRTIPNTQKDLQRVPRARPLSTLPSLIPPSRACFETAQTRPVFQADLRPVLRGRGPGGIADQPP
jgi:hypothetical protein